MLYIKIILLFFLSLQLYAEPILINNNSNDKFLDLLSSSDIFIDETRTLNIHEIIKKEFKKNKKNILSFGYDPKINVWLRFTIKNNTNKELLKIIEYANALTTDIELFNANNLNDKKQEGLFHTNINRNSFNPIFKISIKRNSQETYYIKAASSITTLIVKLKLWNENDFYKKEIKHQLILGLFFGSMLILGLYNLFIYFFTKDKSYLFYVMYIFGIIAHQLIYVGFANIYLLKQETIIFIVNNASILVAFPIFSIGLFTKSFLQLKKSSKLNTILNIFLLLIPISLLIFTFTSDFNKYRNLLSIIFLLYILLLTIYQVINKNRQAYFILFGWIVIFLSVLLMFLSSIGVFNIYEYFSYVIEIALVSEAIIFSIALADRINSLQKEKNDINEKLIKQQKNETLSLSKKVEEKTENLQKTLNEKSLLLKELNHRVKNNMQTIVSLIRLQSDEIKDDKLKDILLTIQNRINAMSHLHELLYSQENISQVNAYDYFETLIEEVKSSYENDIELYLKIECNLEMEQAIYCGLILNELITNSFKYAFLNNASNGSIHINLSKKDKEFTLVVKDNGIGYDTKKTTTSLGLVLINILATQQLDGKITIDAKNGVRTSITWRENEKS